MYKPRKLLCYYIIYYPMATTDFDLVAQNSDVTAHSAQKHAARYFTIHGKVLHLIPTPPPPLPLNSFSLSEISY